jgi:hypothetical protein
MSHHFQLETEGAGVKTGLLLRSSRSLILAETRELSMGTGIDNLKDLCPLAIVYA